MATPHPTESRRRALREIADRTAADIAGDFPGVDTAYDTYIGYGAESGLVYGLIDMGDVYRGTYVWDDGDERWHPAPDATPAQVRGWATR